MFQIVFMLNDMCNFQKCDESESREYCVINTGQIQERNVMRSYNLQHFPGDGRELPYNVKRIMYVYRPEKYPGYVYQYERRDNVQRIVYSREFCDPQSVGYFLSYSFREERKYKVETMQCPPSDKCPVRPMPESTHHEYKKQVEVHTRHRHPVATQ